MGTFLQILIGFLIITSFLLSITTGASYSVHKDMNRKDARSRGNTLIKISFKEFKEIFDSIGNWVKREPWDDSWFSYRDNNRTWEYEVGYIHASIIRMNDRNYRMKNFVQYCKFSYWVWKNKEKSRFTEINYSPVEVERNRNTIVFDETL